MAAQGPSRMVARAAPDQAPGSTADDGEVEHLPGKDGRGEHAHQRHLALAQVSADAAQGVADRDQADDP